VPRFHNSRSAAAARLALAIVAGAAVGSVIEWSVPHLPFALEPLGNSAAPWLIVAFVIALTARSVIESAALAVLTLIALVMGFYVSQDIRGWAVSQHQVVLWTAASFAAGPLVGVAAAWLRRANRTRAALGAGVLGGLLAGEAVYGLRKLEFSTPARYWHVQLVVGIAVAAVLPLYRSRHRLLGSMPSLSASLATCAVVGLGTLIAYQVP
jgi:hypothetical protein